MYRKFYFLLIFGSAVHSLIRDSETITGESLPVSTPIIKIIEGGSFTQKLLFEGKFTSCNVSIDRSNFTLNLEAPRLGEADNKMYADLATKITSLGYGTCGFKFDGAAKTDPYSWNLTAEDEVGQFYATAFKVVFFPKEDKVRTEKIRIGDSKTINCKSVENICFLYNPQGQLILKGSDCSFHIKTITISDLGNWKCLSGTSKDMHLEETTVNLVALEKLNITTWYEEQNERVAFGCKINNYHLSINQYLKNCLMTTPTDQVLNLYNGAATSRYTSLGTNLSDLSCGLEIKKPLQQQEKGLWKCEIANMGALITVETTNPPYEEHTVKNVQLSETLTIYCNVPFASKKCLIHAPNGMSFNNDFPLRSNLGECSKKIEKIQEEDAGIWTCSFARETGSPDKNITIEVKIAESLQYYKTVEVQTGAKATLRCSTSLPLEHCKFQSPKGISYHLWEKRKTPGRIDYCGKGLEHGDCCISIDGIREEDNGFWTCSTKIGVDDKQKENAVEIQVLVELPIIETSLAMPLGLAFGVMVILCLGIVFLVIRRKRKARSQVEQSGNNVRDRSYLSYLGDAEGENIVFQMRPLD